VTVWVEYLQAALLLIAIVWHGGNDRLVVGLIGAFLLSLLVTQTLHGMDRSAALAVLDGFIVFVASRAWISDYDTRGWWVGGLGLIKIGLRLFYSSHPTVSHYLFAVSINCAFIAQVIIAGGILDGLGRRLADHLRNAGPRRARLLRNVEGR
jgi:hypothetical protein